MFETIDDATLLDSDEAEGLIPDHITRQKELNEWEQMNIQKGELWAFRTKHKNILSTEFLKTLHIKMFSETWHWAGQFRKTQKNIGIEANQIPIELKKMFDNVQYWIDHKTYPLEEIAIRLHHQIVYIHPFPNGNGRLSRLYTDLFLKNQGHPKFNWGAGNLFETGELRKKYISALRKADQHDFQDLLDFCL
jgi:Fic-DOC domain mobile mystery protein B